MMNYYTVCNIISDANEIVYSIRIQNYHAASLLLQEMTRKILTTSPLVCDLSVIRELENILKKDDMIYLADWLEGCFLPMFQEISIENSVETIMYDKFAVECTSSGWLTLKNLRTGNYYHSNIDPMNEARIWIEKIYNPEKYEYAVWGGGLGYSILQLYKISNGSIHLTIFYENEEEYLLCQEYGLLSDISEEALTFVHDPEATKFSHFVGKKDCEIVLHFPSIRNINSEQVRQIMHGFFIKWNGVYMNRKNLAINYRNNIEHCKINVDSLEPIMRGQTVIIVGGGPSLDYGLEYLKRIKGRKIIIVATTVLKKLLQLNIVPDYTVVMDAHPHTFGHVSELKECGVPLIIASTAYWEFSCHYQGQKYIAYQSQYTLSRERAEKEQVHAYETGETVVSLALNIAITLGCKQVELLGVDFAFPEQKSHADNTIDQHKVDISDMIQIPDVNGHTVATDAKFYSKKVWMEQKIKEHPEIIFYNLSNCGAAIVGTKCRKIEEL